MSEADKSDKNYNYDQEIAVEAQEVSRGGTEYDAVFGEYKEGQVHYKSVGWCVFGIGALIFQLIPSGLKQRL